MNQRIEKMAEQCRSLYRDGNGGYIEQFDEQKFAELIVRDCTRICAKQAWESRTNDDWTEYNALSRVAGQIKQHFGVEE